MAEMKITFKLGDRDLAYLRNILRQAGAAAKDKSPEEILSAGHAMAKEVREAKPPEYVLERVEKLETIVAMVEDEDWDPPKPVLRKTLTALAYFANPVDLIPDRVPGLGFLDDAIMIELIAGDLKHEIHFYSQFQRYRDSAEQRPWTKAGGRRLDSRLKDKRRELRGKIDSAKAKDAERAQSGGKGMFRW